VSLLAMTHRNCRNVFLQDAEIASQAASGKRKLDPVPSSYHKKYEHLLGREAAKDAARATDANKSQMLICCSLTFCDFRVFFVILLIFL